MSTLHALPNRESLMRAAAARLAEALLLGLEARGQAAAALSGGSTPEPAYALLAAMPLDWPRITFALVDERFVPPSDPASNEAMLRRALAPALEQGARLIPMFHPNATPDEAASRAAAALEGVQFEIAVLGMGNDAHTASWFPHNAKLPELLDPESQADVLALEAAGAAGSPTRLTLTYAALARADALILLITGEEKRARFAQAAAEPVEAAPIAAIVNGLGPLLSTYWAP